MSFDASPKRENRGARIDAMPPRDLASRGFSPYEPAQKILFRQ
jgi:hypothetical protein